MYEKIKKWFRMGLWTDAMVETAFDKGIISQEEYTELMGEVSADG